MGYKEKVQAWLKTREPACDICGASAKLAIGSTHSKSLKPSIRCMDHVHGLRRIFAVAYGVQISFGDDELSQGADLSPIRASGRPLSAAAQDDAKWFSANPHRTHRIRPTLPRDGSEKRGYMAIVRQNEPGNMTYVVLEPCEEQIPDDDDVLDALFDAIKRQSEATGAQAAVNLYDIVLRAVQMKMTGGTA